MNRNPTYFYVNYISLNPKSSIAKKKILASVLGFLGGFNK